MKSEKGVNNYYAPNCKNDSAKPALPLAIPVSANKTDYHTDQSRNECPPEESHCLGIVNTIATVILAIFTIILAIATYWLYRMSRRQNESLERVERANIFINFTKEINDDKLTPILWLQNFGKTPATLKSVKLDWRFGGEIIKERFSSIAHEFPMPNGYVIAPIERIKNFIENRDFFKFGKIETKNFDLNPILHIVGIIKYLDIFEIEHVIEFDWICKKTNEGDFIFYISQDDTLNKYI
jgi:hypothetical protein